MTAAENERGHSSDYGARPSALLIADPAAGLLGAEALAMAGCRIIGPVDWAMAAARLSAQAAVDLVLLEAEDVDADVLAPVLDAAEHLRRDGVAVVAVISEGAIDLAAAHLTPGLSDLLCGPTVADRVGALSLALARRAGPTLHDSGRDGEAIRLQRLNEEVARIAETLARLTRSEPGAAPARREAVADRVIGFRPQPPDAAPFSAPEIRQAIRVRRLRDQFFPDGLFEDPAWDMLLDLFAADLERARVSVSSLCIAAAVAPTTALRWIGRMTEIGLFVREADPFDRRRAFMALSPQARDGMHAYFGAMRRIGAALA